MPHPDASVDDIVDDIASAGEQLTALGGCEGAAGNISVFTAQALEWPADPPAEIELPAPAPSLAGGWVVITASGRRLRDVRRRPTATLVALRVHASGNTAALHAAEGLRPSTDWNSHLAVHEDHRRRRGVERHAVVHAQPVRLTFLSHLPDVTTGVQLAERLTRWQPEGVAVAASGIALAPFHAPGSAGQLAATVAGLSAGAALLWAKHGVVTRSDASAVSAADLVEYLEAAARYEILNLSLGSPALGLDADEQAAVAQVMGLTG